MASGGGGGGGSAAGGPPAKRKIAEVVEVVDRVELKVLPNGMRVNDKSQLMTYPVGSATGELVPCPVMPADLFHQSMKGQSTAGLSRIKAYEKCGLYHVTEVKADGAATVFCAACGKTFVCSNNNRGFTVWSKVHEHTKKRHPAYTLKDDAGQSIAAMFSGAGAAAGGAGAASGGAAAGDAGAAAGGAGAAAGGAGAAGGGYDPEAVAATAERYRIATAASFLADGTPAYRAESVGEQYRYAAFMGEVFPGIGDIPSLTNFKITASMNAAAADCAENTRARVAALGRLRHRGFLPLNYGLQLDKWKCNATGRDIIAILAIFINE
jgi:hypothetical protein